jgi:hypothetical protein
MPRICSIRRETTALCAGSALFVLVLVTVLVTSCVTGAARLTLGVLIGWSLVSRVARCFK